jgi:hypothetical protein
VNTTKKKLFGQPEPNFFSMVEENTNDIPQILTEESEILKVNFAEVEVKEAIMQLQRNKSAWARWVTYEILSSFLGSYQRGFNGYICLATDMRINFVQVKLWGYNLTFKERGCE